MKWARVCDLLFGLWLAASPMWFGEAAWLELGLGLTVVFLASASLLRPDSHIHLWELVPAGAMIALGWFRTRGGQPSPASQNLIVIGLLVAAFAIVPTRSFAPPPGWREEA